MGERILLVSSTSSLKRILKKVISPIVSLKKSKRFKSKYNLAIKTMFIVFFGHFFLFPGSH